jgi:hypothetical protein
LWLIKVADAFGASIMRDHINVVADPLTVADMIAFALRIAACLENRFIRAFR